MGRERKSAENKKVATAALAIEMAIEKHIMKNVQATNMAALCGGGGGLVCGDSNYLAPKMYKLFSAVDVKFSICLQTVVKSM
jgi:hypothetical protein